MTTAAPPALAEAASSGCVGSPRVVVVVVVVLLSPDPTGNCRRPTTHSLPSTPSTHLSIYLGLPNTLDPAPCKVNVTPKGYEGV